jgi:hypothetical protein
MRKSLRYLQITWTAFCAISCVLLCVLWVRSYWQTFIAHKATPDGHTLFVDSSNGDVTFSRDLGLATRRLSWTRARDVTPAWKKPPTSYWGAGFSWRSSPYLSVRLPYWIPTLIFAVASVLPCIGQMSFRFSLRTLLIATTLMAVVLGLAVWATRE